MRGWRWTDRARLLATVVGTAAGFLLLCVLAQLAVPAGGVS